MKGGRGFAVSSLLKVLTFIGPMRSFVVKEKHVDPAISKILWYKHTTDILLTAYGHNQVIEKLRYSRNLIYFSFKKF